MYADDTWIVLNSAFEAKMVIKILEIYGKASGATPNWEKSCIITISGVPIYIDKV